LSRELADDDPEKWVYSEHARAKHAIQWNYLGAWLAILGRHFPKLLLFDGFAGRGRYRDGEEGSPLLFWKRSTEAVANGRPRQVEIRCVELNKSNYENLSSEIELLRREGVTISAVCGRFEDEAASAAKRLIALGNSAPPAFWTADPYGFKGVPLETIRVLMSIPRSEVLITFMVRDMRRFLAEGNFEAPLNEFFGGDTWRECVAETDADKREECLVRRYSDLVRGGIAEFATPFRVFEDDRRQTLYYLIHLTNSALGMREMKEAMVKQSSDMTFWPVSVRNPDQLALDTGEQPPFPRLQEHLVDLYAGQSIKFEDLLNQDYGTGFWIETEYRTAILDMDKRNEVDIKRVRQTPSGQKPFGLKLEDTVRFGLPQLSFD
jgi:three-Cys-motif partner protein